MFSSVPPLALHWHGAPVGAGRPVLLLLHPFPYDARAWNPVLPGLADFTVVTPDLPGCGFSQAWEDTRFEAVAAQLIAHLQDRGVARAVVAGESMGGYLSLALVEQQPDWVAGLGLIDTKSRAETPAGQEQRYEMAQAAEHVGSQVVQDSWQGVLGEYTRTQRPQVVRLARAQLAGARAAGIAWCQRAIAQRPDRHEVLTRYAGPVLLVRGEEDPLSTPEMFAEMETAAQANNQAAKVEVLRLAQCGHLPQFEDPQALTAALQRLVQRSF